MEMKDSEKTDTDSGVAAELVQTPPNAFRFGVRATLNYLAL